MIDPKSIVLNMRPEIAAELAEAEKALIPLQEALDAASAAVDEAMAAHVAMNQYLGKITSEAEGFLGVARFQHLERAIGVRVAVFGAAVDAAKQRRTRAIADLAAATSKVNALRRALAQIDFLIPPEEQITEAA